MASAEGCEMKSKAMTWSMPSALSCSAIHARLLRCTSGMACSCGVGWGWVESVDDGERPPTTQNRKKAHPQRGKRLLRVQPEALPGPRPPRPPRALRGAGLGDGRDDEGLEARADVVDGELHQAAVHDEAHAYRCGGWVGLRTTIDDQPEGRRTDAPPHPRAGGRTHAPSIVREVSAMLVATITFRSTCRGGAPMAFIWRWCGSEA